MEFETRAIHDGQEPDPSTGAILTPIYATSTYVQDEVGKHKGYEYSRTGNPTRTALQECLASLENAKHGLAFASGLAASDAVLRLLAEAWTGEGAVVPVTEHGPEPLHAVYAADALPALSRFVGSGGRSVRGAVAAIGARLLQPDEWSTADPGGRFAANLNAPGDLDRLG